MADLEKKEASLAKIKTFALPVLILALTIFSFSYLIRPKIEQISEISDSIKAKEIKALKLAEKVSLLESFNEEELLARSKLAIEALPEGKKPMMILKALESIANQTGVELVKADVKPGKISDISGEEKTAAPSLNYSIKLVGRLDQIGQFFKKIEKTLPVIRLGDVSLKQESGSDFWDLSADVTAYYLFLPSSLGRVDTPVYLVSEKERKVYEILTGFSSVSFSEPSFETEESGKIDPFI